MSLALFQILCLPVLLLSYGLVLWRSQDRASDAYTIGWLTVAAWAGEQTCISWYGFYTYSDAWSLKLGHVPVLVALIWPMVVLSAREFAKALWPARQGWRLACIIGVLVIFDASLIEVCAVRAGYWSWFEGGYMGVPLMGLIGWGAFAFSATFFLDSRGWTRRAAPILTLVLTHALLLALWWGLFRWGLRDDLGPRAVVGFAGFSAGVTIFVWLSRRRMALSTLVARAAATSVFVALIVSTDQGDYLWGHFGLVAVPYLLASPRPWGRTSEADVGG